MNENRCWKEIMMQTALALSYCSWSCTATWLPDKGKRRIHWTELQRISSPAQRSSCFHQCVHEYAKTAQVISMELCGGVRPKERSPLLFGADPDFFSLSQSEIVHFDIVIHAHTFIYKQKCAITQPIVKANHVWTLKALKHLLGCENLKKSLLFLKFQQLLVLWSESWLWF